MAAKKVKVGNVPNLRFPGFEGEWKKASLGECSNSMDYGMNAAATAFDGQNRYIRITDIDQGSSKYKPESPVSPLGELSDKYLVKKNDILFARTGASTGKTYLYDSNDGTLYFAGFLIRASIGEANNPKFIFAQTQTASYNRWVKLMSMRSGQPGINSQEYASYQFLLPTKGEQDKIAHFLTLIDERTQTQSKIIEELQTLMQILAKKIFSRKIRLKKADENIFPEWDKTKMGDVFEFKVTNSYSREKLNYSEGIIKNIHYGDIHTKYRTLFNIEKEHTPYINLDVNTNSINKESYCQVGDLILADASEDLKDVGKSIEIINLKDQKTLSGLHTILARPLKNIFAIGFCGYLFRSESVRLQIQKEAHGSKVLSIAPVRLSKLTLPIPSLIEQTLIVDFLSSIDEKIEIEKVLLKKYHVQKQYFLQNLFI
ncbi:type I restriction enzyme S subunit [Mucilaginibacter sp. UYP25]|uniref:restriction endonuclease subunit S n=1 Tax=unclassified Mucilaginibacter TaxID=2617802 RepID=UPI003395DF38